MNSVPAVPASPQNDGEYQASTTGLQGQIPRYDLISTVLHGFLAAIVALQLVLGCYLIARPREVPGWEPLFRLHLCVGLASALLVVATLLWRLFHAAPEFPQSIPAWQRSCGRVVNVLLYGVLLVAPFSGYMAAAFGTQSISYPGLPLLAWGLNDPELHDLFADLHRGAFWALAGLVGVHIVVVIAHARRCPGAIARMLPSLGKTKTLLLLAVAASSTYYSVKAAFASPGVFGAYAGTIVLVVTILAFFYCTRIARGFMRTIDLSPSRQRLLGFLGLLSFAGFVGMALALIGAASSIALLVAKTVTQPPGIAITDPSKIIRALDVFVLLANFDVLVAHFIGAFCSLWLITYAFRHTRPRTPVAEGAAAASDAGDLSGQTDEADPIITLTPVSVVQGNTG
ncbi:MAG: Cytochrome [Proteobacteria bacterium]|nr:Cytochrome [Pseudomonadota bacterium]